MKSGNIYDYIIEGTADGEFFRHSVIASTGEEAKSLVTQDLTSLFTNIVITKVEIARLVKQG